MSDNSIVDNSKFWDVLQYLVDLEEQKSFDKICEYFKLTPPMLNSLLNFLKDVDYKLALKHEDNMVMVIPPEEKPKFTMHFNLMEWLAFQAHFPRPIAIAPRALE